MKNVNAGVISIANGQLSANRTDSFCAEPIVRVRNHSNAFRFAFQGVNPQPSFSTVVTADFSISIFTLSATFTITVASFTLEMSP